MDGSGRDLHALYNGQHLVLIQSLQSVLIAFCIEIESNYQPLIVKEILELRATICMVSGVQWRCFSACVIGQSKVHLQSKHLQKQLRKSFKGYWTRIILCTLDSIRLMGTCCFLSFNFFKLQKRLNDTTRSPDSERINN